MISNKNFETKNIFFPQMVANATCQAFSCKWHKCDKSFPTRIELARHVGKHVESATTMLVQFVDKPAAQRPALQQTQRMLQQRLQQQQSLQQQSQQPQSQQQQPQTIIRPTRTQTAPSAIRPTTQSAQSLSKTTPAPVPIAPMPARLVATTALGTTPALASTLTPVLTSTASVPSPAPVPTSVSAPAPTSVSVPALTPVSAPRSTVVSGSAPTPVSVSVSRPVGADPTTTITSSQPQQRTLTAEASQAAQSQTSQSQTSQSQTSQSQMMQEQQTLPSTRVLPNATHAEPHSGPSLSYYTPTRATDGLLHVRYVSMMTGASVEDILRNYPDTQSQVKLAMEIIRLTASNASYNETNPQLQQQLQLQLQQMVLNPYGQTSLLRNSSIGTTPASISTSTPMTQTRQTISTMTSIQPMVGESQLTISQSQQVVVTLSQTTGNQL